MQTFEQLFEQYFTQYFEKYFPRTDQFQALNLKEAGEILGISSDAVADLCKLPREETGFPFAQVTVGGKITIDKFEMIRWHRQGGLTKWKKENE